MKKIIISTALFFCIPVFGISQTLNWASFKKEQSHFINFNTGVEYGLVAGLRYGYKLQSRLPVVLEAGYSFPGGKKLFDDFKTSIGGQLQFYKTGNFIFSTKLHAIFRRYENDFTRLLNIGSDLSTTVGYYRPKWFAAAEAGFDKAIVTHFKHTAAYKEIFPLVKDGWYEPSTGGNFYFGLQGGYTAKQVDLYGKAGYIVQQDLETRSLLPFFVEVGINARLK